MEISNRYKNYINNIVNEFASELSSKTIIPKYIIYAGYCNADVDATEVGIMDIVAACKSEEDAKEFIDNFHKRQQTLNDPNTQVSLKYTKIFSII